MFKVGDTGYWLASAKAGSLEPVKISGLSNDGRSIRYKITYYKHPPTTSTVLNTNDFRKNTTIEIGDGGIVDLCTAVRHAKSFWGKRIAFLTSELDKAEDEPKEIEVFDEVFIRESAMIGYLMKYVVEGIRADASGVVYDVRAYTGLRGTVATGIERNLETYKKSDLIKYKEALHIAMIYSSGKMEEIEEIRLKHCPEEDLAESIFRSTLMGSATLVANVRDFGAVGDGVTDDTNAFRAALNHAFVDTTNTRNKVIYIPYGSYVISGNNPFGDWTVHDFPQSVRFNVRFKGDDWGASEIIYKPVGSEDFYLYDGKKPSENEASIRSLSKVVFEDMKIIPETSGITGGGSINVIRLWGEPNGVPQSGVTFHKVEFRGFNEHRWRYILHLQGVSNADEHTFDRTMGRHFYTLIKSENGQSVVFNVVNSEFGSVKGNLFDMDQGGHLTVTGLSYVAGEVTTPSPDIVWVSGISLNEDDHFLHDGRIYRATMDGVYSDEPVHTSGTVSGAEFIVDESQYLIRVGPAINTIFNINSVKAELWSSRAKIVRAEGPSASPMINIHGSDFRTVIGEARHAIDIDGTSQVQLKMTSCRLNSTNPILFKFRDPGPNPYFSSQGPKVVLDTCHISPDLFDHLIFEGDSGALFTTVHCYTNSNVSADAIQIPPDHDLSGTGTIRPKNIGGKRLKIYQPFVRRWPDAGHDTDEDWTVVKFPKGTIIKNVRFRKVAHGTETDLYQLEVVNQDNSFQYCESTESQQQLEHTGETAPGFHRVLESDEDQIIRLRASTLGASVGKAMSNDDYFIIEYM